MLPKRLYCLDIARGLASFAVVLWHWQHFYYVGGEQPADFQQETQPAYWLLSPLYEHGHAAVAFFFALSGFVFFWLYSEKIASGGCGVKDFARKRLARLYPLHIATLLLVLGLQTVFIGQAGHAFVYQHNDAYHLGLHTFFASYWGLETGHSFNAPVWSVSIEVALYGLFFVLALRGWCSARSCVGMIVAAILMRELPIDARWPPAIEAFYAGGLSWHLVGWYLNHRRDSIDRTLMAVPFVAWAAIAVSPAAADLLLGGPLHLRLLGLFPLTLFGLVVADLRLSHLAKHLAWIGDITYSTYLLHFPLQIAMASLAIGLGWSGTIYSQPVTLVVFTAVLIVLSLVVHHGFERPCQKWMLSRSGDRPPQAAADLPESVRRDAA